MIITKDGCVVLNAILVHSLLYTGSVSCCLNEHNIKSQNNMRLRVVLPESKRRERGKGEIHFPIQRHCFAVYFAVHP